MVRAPRRWLALAAPVLAASLVLSACGGGESGNNQSAPKAEDVGKNDINPVDPAQLKDGGDFHWPLTGMPPNFNYHHLDGGELDNWEVMAALMPTPMDAGADGVAQPDPDYLTSAEVTSTDPQVITYKINPKAKWSDGTPITWEDFQAQWQALNGTNPAFVVSSTTGYEDIEKVEKGADDLEVKVTFKNKFSDWKSLFTPLYPKSTNTDPEVFNKGWVEQVPVSAGPFKFESIDKTAKTITLVRDENWWGAKPKLDRIIYRAIPVDAAADALANGEIDFLDVGPSLNDFTRAQSMQGIVLRQAMAPNFRHITFNGAKGSILEDEQLRIAIQKGINREVIAKAMIGQLIPDAKPLNNHIFVEGLKGYQDNAQIVAYNPEEAKKMLDDLGWKLEGDVRKKDGKELVIRDVIPTQVATSAQEAKQVQQQLAEIGVKVEIVTVPSDDFFEKHVNVGDFDITHFSWIGTPYPVSSKGSIYGLTEGETKQNFGRIGNERINELFAQARAELDEDKKIELANEIDKEIWKTGHSLLLYQRPNIIAVKENVANFGAFGFADTDYTKIGFIK